MRGCQRCEFMTGVCEAVLRDVNTKPTTTETFQAPAATSKGCRPWASSPSGECWPCPSGNPGLCRGPPRQRPLPYKLGAPMDSNNPQRPDPNNPQGPRRQRLRWHALVLALNHSAHPLILSSAERRSRVPHDAQARRATTRRATTWLDSAGAATTSLPRFQGDAASWGGQAAPTSFRAVAACKVGWRLASIAIVGG